MSQNRALLLEVGVKKRLRCAKTPASRTPTIRRRRRCCADEDYIVEGGNVFNDVLDGVSSVAPLVMPLLGAGPDDDELKRLSGRVKSVQKRLRAFVDDKVATMKDDALAQGLRGQGKEIPFTTQGYNPKDPSHRRQMSRVGSECRKAIRTRLGISRRKSEMQNAEAVVRDFRN